MKQHIKEQAARIAIVATREASRLLPKPSVLTPADVQAVQQAVENQYFHFGILDNWYTPSDIRHKVWADKAAELEGKKLIQWNGELCYV